MNPAAPRLVALLEDPSEEWLFDGHVAENKKYGIEVWVANAPILRTEMYPVPLGLGLLDKWRVWRALKVARANYWMRKLTKT